MKYANAVYNKIIRYWELSRSLQGVYLQKITNYNMMAISAAAILAIIMEVIMIIRLFINHPAMDTPASKVYFGFYVSLIAISVVYLVIATNFKPPAKWTYWLQFAFVAVYLLWNILLNSYDLYRNDGGSSLAIVVAVIFSSILIHMRPHHMMFLQMATYALFCVINNGNVEDEINATLAIAVAVIANILFYFRDIQNFHNRQRLAQANARLAKEQLEGAVQYLKRLQENQEQTAIYRHDMRHTLNLVEQLARQGNLEKLHNFVSQSQENLKSITPDIICEHETVNLILGSFKQRAVDKNITFESKINLPKNLNIDDTELCALLFNLLENALLRAEKVADEDMRKVYIKINFKDKKLVMVVKNGYIGNVKMENGVPVCQSNDLTHGYGIQSIVGLVERNNGVYIFDTKDQIFTAKILLNM